MALFGGSGVELLMDPSTSPAEAGEAAAAAEVEGEGGEQKHAGLSSASETPPQLGGGGAGEDKDSGRSSAPPTLPRTSLPPHTAAAAATAAEAGGRASAQPALPARTVGVVVSPVEAAGVKSSVDGNVPAATTLVLPSRVDRSAPAVGAGDSTRDDGVEQRTTQPVGQPPKIGDSKPLPTTPPGTAGAPSTTRAAAASPSAKEPPPQTSAAASAPVQTAARSPGSYPPPPRPVFKMGSLPTRAKSGRPQSPAAPAATTAAAAGASSTTRAPAADERASRSSSAGTGETPVAQEKHLPPSPEVPVAPRAGLKPGESSSSPCFRPQPAPESAIAAAAATTTESAGCVVADNEAEVKSLSGWVVA